MAHVARVDASGVVREVHVISNDDLPNGGNFSPETEAAAQKMQEELGLTPDGDKWFLTSYNSSFRYRYAGPGMKFDPTVGPDGAFLLPQPYPSWTLDHQTAEWIAPIPKPNDGNVYEWAELRQEWVATGAELLPPVND
jgi:peptidoglycan hydrolase-like protein with peptidoglycan-binding domain